MGKLFRAVSVRRLLAGFLICLAVGAVALAEGPPEKDALKKATADGKSPKLLGVLHAPDDKAKYGEFKDYGAFDGKEWAGYEGLPKGHLVYAHPHWYLWEEKGKDGADVPLDKASVKGKYSKLLAVISA